MKHVGEIEYEAELAAAEERGRRSGVEEAAEVCAEKARDFALRAAGQRAEWEYEEARHLGTIAEALREAEEACRALAPRDSGKETVRVNVSNMTSGDHEAFGDADPSHKDRK